VCVLWRVSMRQDRAMQRPFTLDEDQVLALPIDELAIEILRDLVANESEWSSYNWLVTAAPAYGGAKAPAMRALTETWNWLYATGLVATDWGNQSHGAMFVTRRGRRAAAEGLEEVRAAERLAVDLHPLLEAKVRRQFLMQEYELAAFAAMRDYLADEADDDTIYVFATKGGAPSNPDWYYNLTVAGQGTVERGAETYPVTVRELEGDERGRMYDEQARRYPAFAEYAERTAGVRSIPVLELKRSFGNTPAA
jgi:deazaflavin-dependent oxidoreductase (nitroreductase family)